MATKREAGLTSHVGVISSPAYSGLSGITAAVLAGGLGSRLRLKVSDRPKVLAEVNGRPFLTYLLDQLSNAGIRSVVLLIGYMGDMVRTEFGETYRDLKIAYSQETLPLGTGGSLRLASPLLGSETVLVLNGDSFCDADFKQFWSWHCGKGGCATILLTRLADTSRYGRVHVDPEGRILKFDEKNGLAEPGWINAGVYLMQQRLLQTIPAEGAVSLEKEIFPAWVGGAFYGCQTKGRFLDIGTPEAYAEAARFFSNT